VELVDREGGDPPERQKLHQVIEGLVSRGYRYRDLAVLTARNEEVVKITTWLSEKDIPFISYSSLDIRRRRVTERSYASSGFSILPRTTWPLRHSSWERSSAAISSRIRALSPPGIR